MDGAGWHTHDIADACSATWNIFISDTVFMP
jgi:hypothetical protein